MILGTAALIGAILMATLVLTRRAMRAERPRQVALWMIIPVNGIVVAMTVAAVGLGWFFVRKYQYDRCVSTAERSIGSRRQTILLYDTFDVVTGNVAYTVDPQIPGKPSLRTGLDQNLPMLDPADCVNP